VDIKLINQNEADCTMACIAMVGRTTLSAVHKAFPEFDGIGCNTKDTVNILDRLNIPHILYASDRLFFGRLYILTVPSLNILGGNHDIVVINHSDGSTIILDPNNGKDTKMYYSHLDEKNSAQLISWSNPIEIIQ